MRTVIPSAPGEEALAGTYSASISYNLDGTVYGTTDPAAGGLPSEAMVYGYNELGMPKSLNGATGYVQDTQYTKISQLQQITLGVSGSDNAKWVQQTNTYEDGTGRLTRQLVTDDTGAGVVQDSHYGYDQAGNPTMVDARANGVDDTQCYRYDGHNRLTEAFTSSDTSTTAGACTSDPSTTTLGSGPAPYWQTYGYDVLGNRTKLVQHATTPGAPDTTTTYGYGAEDGSQPHTLTSSTTTQPDAGDTTNAYGYDSAGNTTSRTIDGKSQSMAWDDEGHLTQADSTDGTSVSYLYDADGNRLLSRDASGTTLYLGDSEIQLAKGTTSTSGTRYYTWAGQTIAVRTSGGGLQWTLDDAHNTATTQIDATTQAVQERRTDPFGNDRGQAPSTWSGDQGFVGGVQDDTTGLTHLGARDYDPTTGRFVSLDPILELTDPQQINGYSYAANNPVTAADPSGLQLAPAGAGSSYCGGDYTCSGSWADSYAATDKISSPTTHHHCSRWNLSCKAKSAAHHVAKVVKEHPVIAVVIATAVVVSAVACVAATAGACGAVLVAAAEGFTAGAEIGGVGAAVVSGAASAIATGGVTIAAEVATASAAAAVVAEATTTASKEEAAASAGADTAAAAAKDTADSGSTGNRASAASPKSGTATAQGSRGSKGKFKPTLNLFKSSGSGDVGDQVSEASEYRDRVGTAATGAAKYRTYTAGIHIPTGDIAVTCSGGGNCAEVNIVEMTGWDSADILFTRAMALTDIGDGSGKVWQEMPICLTCQRIFKLGNFVPGVLLDR